MAKVKSLAELKAMKEKLQSNIDLREKSDNPEAMIQIKVAMATCGIASGAKQVMEHMMEKAEELKTEPITSAQPQNPVSEPVQKPQSKPAKTWTLKFAVTVTKEQMFALKNFFVSNGIHYEQLEERKENK